MSVPKTPESALAKDSDDTDISVLSRLELEAEIERLRYRESLLAATERVAQIGHYEWNYDQDRLQSCSKTYAGIFNMTVDEVLKSWSSAAQLLQQIHPDDRDRYGADADVMQRTRSLDIEYRIVLADGEVKYVREIGVMVPEIDDVNQRAFGILQDMTNQVKNRRDLEYRDELARQAETITDIGHYIYDEENQRYLYLSEGCARIYGSTPHEYISRMQSYEDDLADIVEEDRDRIEEEYIRYRESGHECALEYRVRRIDDGKVRWVRELGRAKRTKNGRVVQTLGVVQDITERVAHEQELLFKDALANQAEAITDIGHFIYDEINQKYLFVSPGLAQIYGREAFDIVENMIGSERNLKLIHSDDRNRVQKVYDKFVAGGDEWRVDYRLMRNNGEVCWVREMGKAHLIGHSMAEQTIGVLQDITAQKNAEYEIIKTKENLELQVVIRTRELANTVKQLQVEIAEREKVTAELDFLANHDALTGLPSLRLCKDRLEHSLAEARRNQQKSAVMFLDLDGFKLINDTHGHELGDQVLKVIADRIKAEIRETDTVARIGGDEFLIILSSMPEAGISERIANSLIDQIASRILIGNVEVAVSASIGISLYPDHGATGEILIREADGAMYRVKREGKNNFGFAEDLES